MQQIHRQLIQLYHIDDRNEELGGGSSDVNSGVAKAEAHTWATSATIFTVLLPSLACRADSTVAGTPESRSLDSAAGAWS